MAFPIGAEHKILFQGVFAQLQTGGQHHRMRTFIYVNIKFQLAGLICVDLEPATHSGTVGGDAQRSQRCYRIQTKSGAVCL